MNNMKVPEIKQEWRLIIEENGYTCAAIISASKLF